MSGQWPPEWEEPDDGHSDAGLPELQPDAMAADLDLSEVTSFLASVRSPALPAAFEARISGAIAAEAAARAASSTAVGPTSAAAAAAAASAGASTDASDYVGRPVESAGADDAKETVRSENQKEFSPAATHGLAATSASRRPRRGSGARRAPSDPSGPGGSRPDGRRRRLRMPSLQAVSWVLVCCLAVGGFGVLVTRSGGSSSSSSEAASGTAAEPAASAAASAIRPDLGKGTASHAEAEPPASGPTGFLYVKTNTKFERSTLVGQVGALSAKVGFGSGSLTPAASASEPASAAASASSSSGTTTGSGSVSGGYRPSAQLTGCVSQVTGGETPTLVAEAAYDIATDTEVWVVARGCSADDTELITAVPLKG